MQIVYRHVSDLIPYVNNARKNDHAVDAVASSIKNYGFKQPIVIDSQGEVVAGHTRLKAAKKLNMEQVPCIIADDLTPAQIKAYRIADNKVAELSEWDMELLKVELEDIEGFTGFEVDELQDLFEDEAKEESFDAEEALNEIEEPVTQRGWIYKLGNHRLMCGDSTSEKDISRLMNGQKSEMLFTDPPYGVNYEGGYLNKRKREKLKNDENEFIFENFLFLVPKFVDGPCYTWYSDSKSKTIINSILEIGTIHANIIWYKTNAKYAALNQQYKQKHEPCLYWKPKNSNLRWIGPTDECTIWEEKRDAINNFHPTQKPTILSERAIKNHNVTKILDLFGGSGSTLISCEKLKKINYTMELDEKYCDVIVKRWEDYTGLKAERIE